MKTTDVTYSHSIEPMDEAPEGYFASGDDEQDREDERWIRNQLAHGNDAAWCGLVVRAEAHGFHGIASVWACMYESEAELLAMHLEELKAEALDDLKRSVEATRAQLAKFDE